MNFIKKNYLVLSEIILNFLFLLYYLSRSTANIIYGDQFYTIGLVVSKFYEKNFNLLSTLLNVWNTGGIHRGVGGVFFTLFNTKFFKLNTLFEIYLGSFVLFLTAVLLFYQYVKNIPVKSWLTKIFFILISSIVLSLDQAELLGSGNGLYLFCRMLFFIIIFISFENFIKKQTLKNIVFFVFPLFINIFFFSAGYTIAFLVTFLVITCLYYFVNRSFRNKKINLIILFSIILIAFFVYSNGIFNQIMIYQTEPQSQIIFPIKLIFQQGLLFLRFALLTLSANIVNIDLITIAKTINIPDSILIIIASILLLSYFYAICLFFKNKLYKISYLPLFFIIYAFFIYGSIAVTRYSYSSLYPYYSMSSRYTLDTHYGIIGIIWILIYSYLNKIKLKQIATEIKFFILPLLIILFLISGQIITIKTELQVGPYRKIYFNNLQKIALKGEYSNKSEMEMFQNPNPKLVIDSLKFLKKYKLNVFSK